jgi:hypothetical protein
VGAPLLEGAEEEGEDTEPEVVPNFAEAHEALIKVNSFVYAHSNSDGGRVSVLSLESSVFELRRKVSTRQLSITEFFPPPPRKVSSFNEELYHVIANKYKSLNFAFL